ncbi:MAG: pyrroline-5-carboxylate reductase [Deltaproteobacteria bacterium]|nr:pyrroline-5-carboxylate reductase [Deltaproteobacteria bacterium]
MVIQQAIGFIGGGNMGEAMIKGLIKSGVAEAGNLWFFDMDPSRQKDLLDKYGIRLAESNHELTRQCRIIVLAVKPQIIDRVLSEITASLTMDHLLISIAAGITLEHIQNALLIPGPVVRVMPNTPALVMAGATAMSRGIYATSDHIKLARGIFEAVGMVVEVEEKYMDVVTGLSGSGPAYVFTFLDAMTDGGVRLGLTREQARRLCVQTILGSAKLALETGMHPAALRDMVTSPGGTAVAGLFALEKGAFRATVMEAISAASARSKELGSRYRDTEVGGKIEEEPKR